MKSVRVMCFVCAVLCIFAFVPNFALAESVPSWVRVVADNVNLYANCDSSKVIFLAEKSYYLQVLGEENGMYLVSVMQNEELFPQITGYVWKSEVEICKDAPLAPYYPMVRLTVSADSAAVKLSPVPSAETVITVTNTQKVSYYGSVVSYGQSWYYVYFCGRFGYVSPDAVTKPVIALHPTPLVAEVVAPTVTKPAEPDVPEDPVEPDPAGSEIALIVFVAVLALAITLALFLPGNVKKRNQQDVFDKEI